MRLKAERLPAAGVQLQKRRGAGLQYVQEESMRRRKDLSPLNKGGNRVEIKIIIKIS